MERLVERTLTMIVVTAVTIAALLVLYRQGELHRVFSVFSSIATMLGDALGTR